MNVIEVIKQYNLHDFSKHYKNVRGDCVDTEHTILGLAARHVKDIYINLIEHTATITVLPDEEKNKQGY